MPCSRGGGKEKRSARTADESVRGSTGLESEWERPAREGRPVLTQIQKQGRSLQSSYDTEILRKPGPSNNSIMDKYWNIIHWNTK